MPYLDPEERREFLIRLRRVVKHLRVQLKTIGNEGTSVICGPGRQPRRDLPGADYRCVIIDDAARMEMVVKTCGINHKDHLRGIEAIASATGRYQRTATQPQAGNDVITVESRGRCTVEGPELLAWFVENLVQMEADFGVYVRKNWR